MGGRRGVYRILVPRIGGRGHRPLGRPRRRWDIILKGMLGKWDRGVWTESSWLRIGTDSEHL
jgi:hypothetical protein